MLEKLEEIKRILPELLLEKLLDNQLHTMYIDYHKPFVSRIWFQHDDIRVFLHKIEVCKSSSDQCPDFLICKSLTVCPIYLITPSNGQTNP